MDILLSRLALTICVEIVNPDGKRIRKHATSIACSVGQGLAQTQSSGLSPDFSNVGDNCGYSRLPNADIKQDQLEMSQLQQSEDHSLENVFIAHSDPQNVVGTVCLQSIFHRRDLCLKGVCVRIDV